MKERSMIMKERLKKQKTIRDFVKRINPFKRHAPININLREYSRYIRENNIATEDITPEIMNKFLRKS